MTILLDPTSEAVPAERARAARLTALTGQTVGLLDIAKMRGDIFLDRLEDAPDMVRIGNVALEKQATHATISDLSCRFFGPFAIAQVVDGHIDAKVGERQGDAAADAARRTGDESTFAPQLEIHDIPP